MIFLSGDRHLAELSMMDGGVGYPLYDLTSSGLNQAPTAGGPGGEPPPRRHDELGRQLRPDRHRLVAKGPTISLQIRDVDGEITIQRRIQLSTLQPGAIKSPAPPAGE